jgi:hypothetical protein
MTRTASTPSRWHRGRRRAIVAAPPIYPALAPGFLRLPETRSAPVGSTRALHAPIPGGPAAAPPQPSGDRAGWQPARLEAVPAIDAHGRVIAILEHTPGRFDR